MPLQNRVTPFGDVVALPGRGLVLGNRGILHDDHRRLVRQWQLRRWIACRLEFAGRHREVMRPHSYTELFFLDEAAAFAAGHRPCAECRRAAYRRFQELWTAVHGGTARADAMDAVLHEQRLGDGRRKRTHSADLALLPNGTFVVIDGAPYLLWDARLFAWSDSEYTAQRARPARGTVDVLTPKAIVAIFSAGYLPEVHPSVQDVAAAVERVARR
jgi:hypothetical protein